MKLKEETGNVIQLCKRNIYYCCTEKRGL